MEKLKIEKVENKSYSISNQTENQIATVTLTIESNGDFTVNARFKPRHGKEHNLLKKDVLLKAIELGENPDSLNL